MLTITPYLSGPLAGTVARLEIEKATLATKVEQLEQAAQMQAEIMDRERAAYYEVSVVNPYVTMQECN